MQPSSGRHGDVEPPLLALHHAVDAGQVDRLLVRLLSLLLLLLSSLSLLFVVVVVVVVELPLVLLLSLFVYY